MLIFIFDGKKLSIKDILKELLDDDDDDDDDDDNRAYSISVWNMLF